MKGKIRNAVLQSGADVCGFASAEGFNQAPDGFHPCSIFADCKSVVVFGIALPCGLYEVDSRFVDSHYNSLACPQADHIALQPMQNCLSHAFRSEKGKGKSMKKIDCLGEICPVPVMKLQAVIDSIKKGEDYLLVTDHSCTISNLQSFCKANKLSYQLDEVMNGVWEITITASR